VGIDVGTAALAPLFLTRAAACCFGDRGTRGIRIAQTGWAEQDHADGGRSGEAVREVLAQPGVSVDSNRLHRFFGPDAWRGLARQQRGVETALICATNEPTAVPRYYGTDGAARLH